MKKVVILWLGLAVILTVGHGWAGAPRPAGPTLHIDGVRITNLQCGKPLEFRVIIRNNGGTNFVKSAAVRISVPGNFIGHQFDMDIPAGQTITDVQSSLNASFLADCCKEVCFEVSLAATTNGGVLPEWDKIVYKICTKPGSVVVFKK